MARVIDSQAPDEACAVYTRVAPWPRHPQHCVVVPPSAFALHIPLSGLTVRDSFL
jgi:hypothetical protein